MYAIYCGTPSAYTLYIDKILLLCADVVCSHAKLLITKQKLKNMNAHKV